jgi:metal-responsive CopG/Arc/MetJ family transcriptional regulator
MAESVVNQRRVKISLTIDPVLLQAVDEFVAEHPTVNRSRVIEDALRLWQSRQLEQALEAQYAEPLTDEQVREMAAWRHIRRAAAQQMITRDDDR